MNLYVTHASIPLPVAFIMAVLSVLVCVCVKLYITEGQLSRLVQLLMTRNVVRQDKRQYIALELIII